MHHARGLACVLLCIGFCSLPGLGGEKPGEKPRGKPISRSAQLIAPDIAIDVPFVLVPVHVTTAIGRPITHLELKDFHIFDENLEHSIKTFVTDDAPISVGVVFDCSGSMKTKMRKSIEATAAFLRTTNDADEHFLIEFGDRAKVSVPFTSDSTEISARISRIRPFGRTSLFDAIQLALLQMRYAKHNRKAIVIFSDGGDNCSRKTFREIRRTLLEADVQVYAVGIIDQTNPDKLTREELAGPRVLDDLAEATGGIHLRADLTDMTTISERIGNELRSRYLLGYSPKSEVRDGKYHRVKVTVTPTESMPDLRVSYRPGYYAASN
jgi:Ca-activated chloride channel homolog